MTVIFESSSSEDAIMTMKVQHRKAKGPKCRFKCMFSSESFSCSQRNVIVAKHELGTVIHKEHAPVKVYWATSKLCHLYP